MTLHSDSAAQSPKRFDGMWLDRPDRLDVVVALALLVPFLGGAVAAALFRQEWALATGLAIHALAYFATGAWCALRRRWGLLAVMLLLAPILLVAWFIVALFTFGFDGAP